MLRALAQPPGAAHLQAHSSPLTGCSAGWLGQTPSSCTPRCPAPSPAGPPSSCGTSQHAALVRAVAAGCNLARAARCGSFSCSASFFLPGGGREARQKVWLQQQFRAGGFAAARRTKRRQVHASDNKPSTTTSAHLLSISHPPRSAQAPAQAIGQNNPNITTNHVPNRPLTCSASPIPPRSAPAQAQLPPAAAPHPAASARARLPQAQRHPRFHWLPPPPAVARQLLRGTRPFRGPLSQSCPAQPADGNAAKQQ